LRYERRMTQAELGRGRFSVSYISAVERGAIRPSLQALDHLATTLQVPVTSLLADTTMLPPSRRRAGNPPREIAFWELARAQVTLAQGDPDAALTILNGLSAQILEPAEHVQRHHLAAECHLALGRHDAARASAAEGVRLAEAVGDRGSLARLLVVQARAYGGLASPDLALDLVERALDLFASVPYRDPIAELDATLLAYEIARHLEHAEQAMALLKRAQRLAATLGALLQLAALALAQAQQAIKQGDTVAVERFLARVEATLAHETACAAQGRIRETIDRVQQERTHALVGGTHAFSG
jgi:transcriptional regulator with XRE-family HTH domain